jgi:predicted GNAT family N-acyltransferase
MVSPVLRGDEFRIAEITGTELVPLTYKLRYRVWSKETRLVDSIHQMGAICDEHEAHSRHWAAFSQEGILVASARLCMHDAKERVPDEYCYTGLDLPPPLASINRLVVERSARNRGIAEQLDLQRIEAAKNAGAACIVGAPTSDNRIRALGKLGFSLKGSRGKSHYLEDFWLSVMVLDLRGAG